MKSSQAPGQQLLMLSYGFGDIPSRDHLALASQVGQDYQHLLQIHTSGLKVSTVPGSDSEEGRRSVPEYEPFVKITRRIAFKQWLAISGTRILSFPPLANIVSSQLLLLCQGIA